MFLKLTLYKSSPNQNLLAGAHSLDHKKIEKKIYVFQTLKVSKFQNEFMKPSFLPKYEPKIVRISALTLQGRNPKKFWFIFWEKR